MDATLNTWTNPRNGQTRRYVQNLHEIIEFDYDTYKTGNIRDASLGGYGISNSDATKLRNLRVWLDENDEIHVEHNSGRNLTDAEIIALVEAALAPEVETVDEDTDEADDETTVTYGNHGDAEQSILDLLGDAADDFDVAEAFNDLFDYDEATSTHRPTTTSVDEIMTILDRYDRTAQRAADAARVDKATREEAEKLHAAIVTSARTAGQSVPAAGLTITYNTEFAGGGLDKWPTSKHFWIDITAPDGVTTRVGTEAGSWLGFYERFEEAKGESLDRLVRRRDAIAAELRAAATRHAAALRELADARAALDPIVRRALDDGMSAYRVAVLTDLSQPTVARIRDAGASAADEVA